MQVHKAGHPTANSTEVLKEWKYTTNTPYTLMTCTETPLPYDRQPKMVDDVDEGVEGAFKCLVSITDRSCNLRKDLKKEILEAVSSLKDYIAHVQSNLDSKTEANKKLELEVKARRALETLVGQLKLAWDRQHCFV
jgi:acetolactate synthase regulatory subunit